MNIMKGVGDKVAKLCIFGLITLSLFACKSIQTGANSNDAILANKPVDTYTEQDTIIEVIKIIDGYKPDKDKKIFIREYTYSASEDDSKNVARYKALKQIKKQLIEEVGSYIESELNIEQVVESGTTINNIKKEISTISAGVVQAKIVEEKWNGESFYLKASVAIDPNSVTQGISEALKLRSNQEEISDLRIILQEKSKAFSIQGQQLTKVQKELSQRMLTESAARKELFNLKKQLVDINKKLEELNAQKVAAKNEFDRVIASMKQSASDAKTYVRYGMNKKEVLRLAGSPRNLEEWQINDQVFNEWNYGDVWVKFDSGVVNCVVKATDDPLDSCSWLKKYKPSVVIR